MFHCAVFFSYIMGSLFKCYLCETLLTILVSFFFAIFCIHPWIHIECMHGVMYSFFAGHHSIAEEEGLVRSKRKTDRLTAYACEDTTLNITCGADLYLDVIRANYGRFSITICNDHGNTDWKVDCQAGRTLRAMQARCSNKKQCIVPVQSSIFGDPCPGTYKYIEVHYACRKGNTCNTLFSWQC